MNPETQQEQTEVTEGKSFKEQLVQERIDLFRRISDLNDERKILSGRIKAIEVLLEGMQ